MNERNRNKNEERKEISKKEMEWGMNEEDRRKKVRKRNKWK